MFNLVLLLYRAVPETNPVVKQITIIGVKSDTILLTLSQPLTQSIPVIQYALGQLSKRLGTSTQGKNLRYNMGKNCDFRHAK